MADENIVKQDGPYENVFLAVNTKKDRSSQTKLKSGRRLEQTQLEILYEEDGFAKRVIDLPTDEMVRAGFTIEGIDNDGDVLSSLEAINAVPKVADALRWASLYGGALIVMLINDGGALEEPLNEDRIKELEQIRVYDRWQVARQQTYSDPADKRFGSTQLYQVSPVLGSPYIVHESRCIEVDGLTMPERIRSENDYWGGSVLQHCYTQLQRFGMSHVWGNALLERAQQAIHGIPGLTNLLRTKEGETLVRKRVDLVDMARSINNTVVIDGEETYDIKATSLSGVSDIIDRLGLALSAVTGIPESLLFGRQQSGLNSSGKGELENWYARIKQDQVTILLPIVDRIVTIQLKASGTYKDDYLIKFNPLTVPSEKDKADTDYKQAQTFEIYWTLNAMDSSEIRKMLPDLGYDIDNVEQVPENSEGEDDTPQDPEENISKP